MKIKGHSKRIIIISSVVIVIVAAAVVAVTSGPDIEYETSQVERGEVKEVVSATGSIAPSSKIKLQPEVGGKVESVSVEEGDAVERGDLLLKLQSGDIEAQILAQRASLASARARLAEHEAGPTQQEIELAEKAVETAQTKLAASESAMLDAEQALENAQRNLENTQVKAETQIDLKLSQFVSDIEDAYITANDAVNRLTDPLFDSENFLTFGVTSAQVESDAEGTRASAKDALTEIQEAWHEAEDLTTVENVQAQYETITPQLNAIKEHLEAVVDALNYTAGLDSTTLSTYKQNADTALSGVTSIIQALENDQHNLNLQTRLNETEIISAEIAVSNAQAALNTARNNVKTNERLLSEAEASLELKRTGTREEVIESQRAVVSAERAKLAGLQNELDKRTIKAPVDGTVSLVGVEVGENVTPNQTVLLLNAKGNLEVVANISEIDIAQISIGDPVEVTLDAFSEEEAWQGTVIAIQPAETVVDSVIFYETTVRFDSEDERLRSGMTANLDIKTDEREGVVRIPVRALRQSNGDIYVEVMDKNENVKEVNIEVGLESDEYVEVVEGLEEGQTVVVFSSEE